MANGYTPDPLYMEDPLMSLPEEELQEVMEEDQLAQIQDEVFAQELGAIDEQLANENFRQQLLNIRTPQEIQKEKERQQDQQGVANFLAQHAAQEWPWKPPVQEPPQTQYDDLPAQMERRDKPQEVPLPDQPGAEAQAYRREAAYWRNMADREERARNQRIDFGGEQPETYAEAQTRLKTAHLNRVKSYQNEFDRNFAEAQLGAKYPGISTREARELEDFVRQEPSFNLGADERRDFLRKQARAQRKLDRAQRIDPMGAYGNLPSQILAALSVGFGGWAAGRTGGRNEALDLYKFHINNDIASQKEMFQRKTARPGQLQNQYGFWMKRYGDENVAELGVAAAKWNEASSELQRIARETKYKPLQFRAEQAAAKAEDIAARAAGQLRKAAMLAEAEMDSGMSTFKGETIRWLGKAKGRKSVKDSLGAKEINKKIDEGSAFRTTLSNYKKAAAAARGTLPNSKERASADIALNSLIAAMGVAGNVGIMSDTEYQRFEGLIPTPYRFMEAPKEVMLKLVGQPDKLDFVVAEVEKGMDRGIENLVKRYGDFEIVGQTTSKGTGRTGFSDSTMTEDQKRIVR